MRASGLSHPQPKFRRQSALVFVATAVGATMSTSVAFSQVNHPAAETLVVASAAGNTPALLLAQANTSLENKEHPASSLSVVDEAKAYEPRATSKKIYSDTSPGSAQSKFQYFKPFSNEWKQRREEEARRLKAATTICRC